MRGKIEAMRRIQAASLIVALLAAPLALMTGAQAGAAQQCAMACCRGRHVAAAKMQCGHTARDAQSVICQCTERGPDYGLNSPLPPFHLSPGAKLTAMRPMRASFSTAAILDSAGYFPPPFNPPKA